MHKIALIPAEKAEDERKITAKDIQPLGYTISRPSVRMRPAREASLDDAFALLGGELAKYRAKAEATDQCLSQRDMAMVIRTVDTLTKLVRTDHKNNEHQDPGKLSDEELLAALPKAQELLASGKSAVVES